MSESKSLFVRATDIIGERDAQIAALKAEGARLRAALKASEDAEARFRGEWAAQHDEVARLREREVDIGRALDALGENRVDLPRIARDMRHRAEAAVADAERLRELIGGYFRVPSSEWIEALKAEARAALRGGGE